MNRKTDKYIENSKLFRCPVCGGKLNVTGGGSFVCRRRHCFDLSAKGYVNLLGGQGLHKNKYDRNLFECRNEIFRAGFYDAVLAEIADVIRGAFPQACGEENGIFGGAVETGDGESGGLYGETDCEEGGQAAERLNVFDAGCGEGFYLNRLACCPLGKRLNLFGLDLIKEAIQIACREQNDVKWIVGNLADIPLFNKLFDVVLNVLTPANYKEFNRILKRTGILVKIIPGADYLGEVRRCVSDQLLRKDYSNESTVKYFEENMELMERREVRYALPVTEEQARLFLQMTPMTFHVNTAEISPERIAEIREMTIHMEILVGRKKGGEAENEKAEALPHLL